MSNPIWFTYVPVALIATLLWVRRLTSHEPRNWSQVLLFASIIFAIHFFLPFYVLGLFELISKHPAIHASSATILCLATFCIGWLIWGRHVGQLKESGEISEPAATAEPQPPRCIRTRSLDRVARTVLALTLVVVVAIAAMSAYGGFPGGYESIAYHLPIGVNLFQTGSLKVWDHAYMHTFPANASIWCGYWLALGSERVTAVAGLVLLVPLSAGLNEIGRALGVNRARQDLTLAGFLTIPLVGFVAGCGSDGGGIAWLACALALALTNTTGQINRTALTGICLGLAYGFKSLHLVGAVLVALWLLYSDLRRIATQSPNISNRQSVLATTVKTQIILMLSFLVMGGYWLARNWVEFGNPFYPVQIPIVGSIAGWSVAPDFSLASRSTTQFEWVRSSAEWVVYPWIEWQDPQNVKGSHVFGPFVASVVLVAVFAALVTLRLRTDSSIYKRAFLILGGGAIIFVWWVLGDRQPRYLMGAFVFWVPLAGWFLSSLPNRWAPLEFGVATVSVLTMLGVIFTKQALEFGDHFVLAKQKNRWEYYEYPRELDTLLPNSVIMNLVERPWNYPLFGKTLSLRVVNFMSAQQLAVATRSAPDSTLVEFKFNADVLKTTGITHLFALDSTAIEIDGCVTLNEIGRFDRQPSNGNPVRPARVLYAVVYPTEPCSSSGETRNAAPVDDVK